ncbi:substrate-binding domain-containing protein [Clostridium estertheticum]|uniref:substrate-binding domain-containing protein n=1 Tax=Clostridium estertheticum TaxID=238834 RepID=UPI001CD09549|nr:substrate-binding domain-containing protein [Clostridium estertheticum]MBZ9686032.1 substrate-binding domain-containing protein [Clostridium estertheticum]
MFKIILLIETFLVLFFSVGCVSTDIATVEKKKTIAVIVKTKGNDFWKTVMLGAEAAAKEFDVNVEFTCPPNEKDADGQIEQVNRVINKKVDAIVLAACDYEKLVPVTEKAIDKGIPVVIIDSELNSSKISSFIATDNKEAGNLAGQKLLEIAGEQCNVVVMSFVKGTATANQREKGLFEVINKHPGIKVLDIQYCYSEAEIAREQTKMVIKKYDKIDAIVALNGPAAMGVADAIQNMNLQGKVKVIGFDSTHEEIDFMEADVIQATIVQNPFNMGYLGVKSVLEVLNEKSVPKNVDTGSKVIDKKNMYTPENQKLLFPFVN